MGLVLVLNGGYKWDETRDISSCVNVISYYWLLASTILFLGWDDWISDVAMIGGSDGWWIRWLCLWLLWLLWCVLRLLLLLLWFLFFVFVIFDIDAQMDMDFWIFVWFLFLFVLLSPSPFFVLQCAPIFGSSSNQVYNLWYTTCEYCLWDTSRATHEDERRIKEKKETRNKTNAIFHGFNKLVRSFCSGFVFLFFFLVHFLSFPSVWSVGVVY